MMSTSGALPGHWSTNPQDRTVINKDLVDCQLSVACCLSTRWLGKIYQFYPWINRHWFLISGGGVVFHGTGSVWLIAIVAAASSYLHIRFVQILISPFPASYFLLLAPQEVAKKEGTPMSCPFGIPSSASSYNGSRLHDLLSWSRSSVHPCTDDPITAYFLGMT